MKASLFYRIAGVLLLLFSLGHTLGFRQSDPTWGVDTLLGLMRSIHFDVQGFSRTYWDLFEAAGFSVGVFYLFAAVLAWQLGGLPAGSLAAMRVTAWALALCFAAITVVSWRYYCFFNPDYGLLGCGGLAFSKGNLKTGVGIGSTARLAPGAWFLAEESSSHPLPSLQEGEVKQASRPKPRPQEPDVPIAPLVLGWARPGARQRLRLRNRRPLLCRGPARPLKGSS